MSGRTIVLRSWFVAAVVLSGCVAHVPTNQRNVCAVFDQYPEWYDAAREAEETWNIPAPILMAFVRQESGYRADARPPFEWFWFIPLGRASSAYGYGQIQDPAWEDYKKANGGWFRSRSDMDDVLDFIGWYNDVSVRRLGIARTNARHLYLAYHEGHAGYRRGRWRHDEKLRRVADKVARNARRYRAQLHGCEDRFRCRHWYSLWPFCS